MSRDAETTSASEDAAFGAGAADAFAGGTPNAEGGAEREAAAEAQMADVGSTGTAEPLPEERS